MGKEMTESVADVLGEMRGTEYLMSPPTQPPGTKYWPNAVVAEMVVVNWADRIEAALARERVTLGEGQYIQGAGIDKTVIRRETPERKAFVEAAIAWCVKMRLNEPDDPDDDDSVYDRKFLEFAHAYRAMIERERNDAE